MPAVDLGANCLVAEIGVHGISKIDGGRALGHLQQSALGGESENPVLIHGQPGVLEQLFGIFRLIENFYEISDPAGLTIGPVALFIGPVRGEAELIVLVHAL